MDAQQTFHCQSNGATCGPYTHDDMTSYLANGQLNPTDLVHDPASNSWVPIGQFLSSPPAPFPSNAPFIAPMPSALINPRQPAQSNLMQPMMSASPQFAPMQPMPTENNSKRTLAWVFGSLGALAVIIILIAVFTNFSKNGKLMEVHNSMVRIEQHFLDRSNAAINGSNNDTIEMSAAADEAAMKLRTLDSSDCPDEYILKLGQFADIFEKIASSIDEDNLSSYESLTQQRLSIGRQLNDIARANGIEIESGY